MDLPGYRLHRLRGEYEDTHLLFKGWIYAGRFEFGFMRRLPLDLAYESPRSPEAW